MITTPIDPTTSPIPKPLSSEPNTINQNIKADVSSKQFIRHELKSPIGAVRGYLSMIQDGDYGKLELTPEQKEVFIKIEKNLDELTDRINTLLKD